MPIDYKKVMLDAFDDELSQIVDVENQPTVAPPSSEYPNSLSRSGKIPEHISTFLSKRAAVSPSVKFGGTAAGSIAGWELLKRMNEDRRLGRMVRRQSEQQQNL